MMGVFKETPIKTAKVVNIEKTWWSYRSVFQLRGRRYLAATSPLTSSPTADWETMIFETSQAVPDNPDDIDLKKVTSWIDVYRFTHHSEPTIQQHEKTIRDWARKQLITKVGKLNG